MKQPARRQFDEPDLLEIQEEVIQAVQADPEKFFARYKAFPQSFGGRYVNSDLFKETFEPYNRSKESRGRYNQAVHNSAATLAAEQFRRALQEPKEPGKDMVILLTGIPGAGKTSSVMKDEKMPFQVHAIYEGQLAVPEVALGKVQEVLDAGFKPFIVVVHPIPEKALDNTFHRFNTEGRGASIETMAKVQGEMTTGLMAVLDKFGPDRVQLQITDRRKDYFDPVTLEGWEHLPVLRSEGNHEQIRQRLERRLEARRNDISDDAWRQAKGLAPLGEIQSSRVAGREHESNLARPEAPGGSREEAVLTRSSPARNPARWMELDSDISREISDHMAVQSALAHLGEDIDTLREAAEGRPLNDAQRQMLRDGWNGRLILGDDRLTRLGELAYSTASKQLAAPERQSPEISEQERQDLAQQRQWQQRQIQSRNIAQREEADSKAQELTRKIEGLKEQAAEIKAGETSEPAKQERIEQLHKQERDIVREAPQEVRARIPKRDRGLER
ncbi:MAG: hypothetical protein LBI48_09520 [Burkholderiaceae bacterium]|jgi:hypothetical protein|nr:hypothetical protein [Burkholderiaceae bacterium]